LALARAIEHSKANRMEKMAKELLWSVLSTIYGLNIQILTMNKPQPYNHVMYFFASLSVSHDISDFDSIPTQCKNTTNWPYLTNLSLKDFEVDITNGTSVSHKTGSGFS
jgi:hypothetical protein